MKTSLGVYIIVAAITQKLASHPFKQSGRKFVQGAIPESPWFTIAINRLHSSSDKLL